MIYTERTDQNHAEALTRVGQTVTLGTGKTPLTVIEAGRYYINLVNPVNGHRRQIKTERVWDLKPVA
jgi:hypothetical protein